jgi:hypothetical protein
MMFLSSKKYFQLVLVIRVFLENGLGSVQTFFILLTSNKPEVLKKIPKTVMKTRFKVKENMYTLIFVNTLWVVALSKAPE